MKRRAILIEAADLKGLTPLPGAVEDLKNYQRHLCSIDGGRWFPSEIRQLIKPSKLELMEEIRKAEMEAEYLFIAFSGHGYTKANSYVFPSPTIKQLTMLCLNDTDEISLAEINPTIKNLIIADSCRNVEQVEKVFASFSGSITDYIGIGHEHELRARLVFDVAVRLAEAGQIIAYSFGINEGAGEDKNRGGYLSAAMIECGKKMAVSGFQRAISTKEIFDRAVRVVKTQSAQQNPLYVPGHRLRDFPFAVKI